MCLRVNDISKLNDYGSRLHILTNPQTSFVFFYYEIELQYEHCIFSWPLVCVSLSVGFPLCWSNIVLRYYLHVTVFFQHFWWIMTDQPCSVTVRGGVCALWCHGAPWPMGRSNEWGVNKKLWMFSKWQPTKTKRKGQEKEEKKKKRLKRRNQRLIGRHIIQFGEEGPARSQNGRRVSLHLA